MRALKLIPPSHRNTLICLGLVALTLFVYRDVTASGFINLDDTVYVSDNPVVQSGLTRRGIAWSFGLHGGNWHPLTWLSHMFDWQLFGSRAGLHHLSSLLMHCINAVLLFLALNRMTATVWPVAAVALAFALHPLQVESVAWISERKNVLSTLFWFLCLLAYAHYVHRPRLWRYALVLMLFGAGLMAKPMLVTLPFALLLLDWWPFGRFGRVGERSASEWGAERTSPYGGLVRRGWAGPVVDKIPMLLLSAASCIVTVIAQTRGGAVVSLRAYPFGLRATNALVSYVRYLGKFLWPQDLVVYYPYPAALPAWQWIGATAVIMVVTAVVIWRRRHSPWLLVGWLWFLGTLVPVIGLVQVGGQAMADRYAYVPLVGLAIGLAWEARRAANRLGNHVSRVTVAVCLVMLVACSVRTYGQVELWRNDRMLFRHAVENTRRNARAWYSLGLAHLKVGELASAERSLDSAVTINPRFADGYVVLGLVEVRRGDYKAALNQFKRALKVDPRNPQALANAGAALIALERHGEARTYLEEALRVEPGIEGLESNLQVARENATTVDESAHREQGDGRP